MLDPPAQGLSNDVQDRRGKEEGGCMDTCRYPALIALHLIDRFATSPGLFAGSPQTSAREAQLTVQLPLRSSLLMCLKPFPSVG